MPHGLWPSIPLLFKSQCSKNISNAFEIHSVCFMYGLELEKRCLKWRTRGVSQSFFFIYKNIWHRGDHSTTTTKTYSTMATKQSWSRTNDDLWGHCCSVKHPRDFKNADSWFSFQTYILFFWFKVQVFLCLCQIFFAS